MRSVARWIVGMVVGAGLLGAFFWPQPARAAEGEFALQVYPSPLVATVKPGQATNLELKIRNGGPGIENLKIAVRSFKIDPSSQDLQLNDSQTPEIASWVTFSAPAFSVQSAQTATESITLNVPKDAGFSYAFALVISRADSATPTLTSGGRILKAQVAVFALINVDRPGAVRSLQLTRFSATQGLYQYLPVEFQAEFKNTGNTIVQPGGSIFVQRGTDDKTPIDTLEANSNGGYILPGMSRTFKASWANGFQVMTSKPQADGTSKKDLVWNWNQLGDIRIGKYTAKLVAVYDDGLRDVPLQAETTFWVVPWLVLLVILVVLALVALGIWSLVSAILRLSKKVHPKRSVRF